jgi:4a-hydroxytetrahydrobiopterin dehydratase
MATPLAERHCVVCRQGTPPLRRPEIELLLAQVPGWSVDQAEGHPRLARMVRFKGFMRGVELVGTISGIAEAESHHPDLLLTYGSLGIWLWTHVAGGLTENDFIVAARISAVI